MFGFSPVRNSRIFIGSSTLNIKVARAVADCLKSRGLTAMVWDEGVFRQNEATLDGLLRISSEVDFAVFIWGPSDVTTSSGQSVPSPRDNVVFETGMLLGALGKNRVFIMCDQTVSIKIPTDYAGITRGYYNSSLIGSYDISAVSSACNVIERSIHDSSIQSPYSAYAGQWKSKYAAGPDINHREVADDVEINAEPDGISFVSNSIPGLISYQARGKVYYKNQIMGQWTHPSDRSLAEGLFILTVSPAADFMYGYSTSRDAYGAMIYGTWVFAKKDGRTDAEVIVALAWAQNTLMDRTISPPMADARPNHLSS